MKSTPHLDPSLMPAPFLSTQERVLVWEKELLELLNLKEDDLFTPEHVRTFLNTKHPTLKEDISDGLRSFGLFFLLTSMAPIFDHVWLKAVFFGVGLACYVGASFMKQSLKEEMPTLSVNKARKHRLINVWLNTTNPELKQKIQDFLPYYSSPQIKMSFWERMHKMMRTAPYTKKVMAAVDAEALWDWVATQDPSMPESLELFCFGKQETAQNELLLATNDAMGQKSHSAPQQKQSG